MQPQILSVDILDDKEPNVLVQKYVYPDRTFQVFRKPTSADEEFVLSPGIEIDPDLYWRVSMFLFDSANDLAEDGILELFAVVYLDDENPPTHDTEAQSEGQELLNIAFDPDDGLYHCEPTLLAHERLGGIATSTLDEAITLAVDGLHAILATGESTA